jgi:hypothetical protein
MLWALCEEVIRISMSTATYDQPISLNLNVSSPAMLTCGETRVGFCFYSMDQVWEESTIVDEETRYMVSDEIMVSALTVDLRSESMCIASRVCSTNSSHNDRETSKNVTGGVSLHADVRLLQSPVGVKVPVESQSLSSRTFFWVGYHKLRVPMHGLLSQEHARGQSVTSSF